MGDRDEGQDRNPLNLHLQLSQQNPWKKGKGTVQHLLVPKLIEPKFRKSSPINIKGYPIPQGIMCNTTIHTAQKKYHLLCTELACLKAMTGTDLIARQVFV